MKIRKAELSDKKAVLALLIELKKNGYAEMGVPFRGIEITPEAATLFELMLKREDVCILVADDDGEVVGVCVAYETPKIIEGTTRMVVEEMVVNSKARNQGIGSNLLMTLEKITRARGIKLMKLTTGTKLKANEFYKKHGFVLFENAYRKKLTD